MNTGRVAIINRGEYSDTWQVFVRIPESLSADVLGAWLGDESWLFAIVRDVEQIGPEAGEVKCDEPERGLFCREHRETAVAMIKAGVALDDERRAAE